MVHHNIAVHSDRLQVGLGEGIREAANLLGRHRAAVLQEGKQAPLLPGKSVSLRQPCDLHGEVVYPC